MVPPEGFGISGLTSSRGTLQLGLDQALQERHGSDLFLLEPVSLMLIIKLVTVFCDLRISSINSEKSLQARGLFNGIICQHFFRPKTISFGERPRYKGVLW